MKESLSHPSLEHLLQYIDEHEKVSFVYGICIKSTGTRGECCRLGRVQFGLERCELFMRGFEVWKKGGSSGLYDEHPTSLNARLFHSQEIRLFTII